jgi:hypothetical protein
MGPHPAPPLCRFSGIGEEQGEQAVVIIAAG